jgi:hypothetical protein
MTAAGAVGAEEREDLAGADIERDAVDSLDGAEGLDQTLHVDHGRASSGGDTAQSLYRENTKQFSFVCQEAGIADREEEMGLRGRIGPRGL